MSSAGESALGVSSIACLPVELQRGSPLPYGATVLRGGVNFSIYSKAASQVELVLFVADDPEPIAELSLDPQVNKTGDVWHAFVAGLGSGARYGYRMDRVPNDAPQIHRFQPRFLVSDPYARALSGRAEWGHRGGFDAANRECPEPHLGLVVVDAFDWGDDQPLNVPLADSVIYELHARGFTCHPSSGVRNPGTFSGLVEKIPYLVSLGVTAVEILPINEFDETDTNRVNPVTQERLVNYWGYHPISFFATKSAYASERGLGAEIREFKTMVKALHRAGIEVILDVVFNHTAEGDERGPTWSFRGIDNTTYYIIDRETGAYHNYSGCGNTVNCNHPVVREVIIDALHYWVTEMHVDGFRFDLASILGRGQDGAVLPNPPLLERIAFDPILANTKLIAEAWDAAGLYQVGSFPAWSRWAEWNGRFRDDLRSFVRGDPGKVSALATRLAGSADLYETSNREPYHSINFVTCHDGFTLWDLVSYNEKHNHENGEDSRDGDNHNLSWNCGHEGPTDDPEIDRTRRRQVKNMAALLLFANGVPMLLAGDEIGRSQRGNNNAYCQDSQLSWMDWGLLESNHDLVRFFRGMIRFRHDHAVLRRKCYLPECEGAMVSLEWHGLEPFHPDWSPHSRSIAKCVRTVTVSGHTESLYLAVNAYWEALDFQLPHAGGQAWHRVADTWLESPNDIVEPGTEPRLDDQDTYRVHARSVVLLIAG